MATKKSLGTLTIDLIAETSGFTQGMDRAEKTTKVKADQIERSINKVRLATIAIGAAAGAAFAGWALSISKSMDATLKMADQIGTTTEALTGLRYAAEQFSNVSENTLDMSLRRMTRRIAEAAAGAGAAKTALEDLGLSAQELNKVPVDEQFLRIADAMQKAGSQGAKLRNTMAIFDTEGVALVNTLSQGSEEIQKMIAEAERFGIIVSTESARAASEFQDNLGRLNAMASGFSITLGNQLIPVINDFVDNIIDAASETDGLYDSAKTLANDRALPEWIDSVGIGLARLIDVMVALGKAANAVVGSFKSVFADLDAGMTRLQSDPLGIIQFINPERAAQIDADLKKTLEKRNKTVEDANQAWIDLWEHDGNRFEQAWIRATEQAQFDREFVGPVRPTLLDSIDVTGSGSGSKTKNKISEGERYIESLKRQMESVSKLTELETLRNRMAEGSLTFATQALEDQAVAYAQTIDFIKEQEEAYKLLEASRKEFASGLGKAPEFGGIDALIGGAAGELLKTGEAAEELQEWYEAQLEAQREFLEQGVINEQEYADRVYEITKTNAERMESIQRGLRTASISLFQDMTSQSLSALETLGQKGSGIYKALFIANKAAAIAQAIINTEEGATKALAVLGPAGPPVALLIRAAGYTSVAAMAATTIAGMAHDGIDSVPQDGTWLLQKGERVTTAETSAKLDATLERINSDMRSSRTGNGTVVNVIEDPRRAGQVETRYEDDREIIDVVVADIRSDGRSARALEATYGLRRQGR